jgi:hypothetical protein
MGKRSDFPRRAMDAYATPHKAVVPVIPFLRRDGIQTFDEPCAGLDDLVDHLRCYGFDCLYAGDIQTGQDALDVKEFRADAVVTNPPWTRQLMHPLIWHFMRTSPITWLLFDSDWCHTKQATGLLAHCTDIVSVGRQKWMPDSKHSGKDNASWHRFDIDHLTGPHFHSQYQPVAVTEAKVKFEVRA